MGCLHSRPVRAGPREVQPAPVLEATFMSFPECAVSPKLDMNAEPVAPAVPDECVFTPVESMDILLEEFTASPGSESEMPSAVQAVVSPALAEQAHSSTSSTSSFSIARPDSPDFVISPNPGSPTGLPAVRSEPISMTKAIESIAAETPSIIIEESVVPPVPVHAEPAHSSSPPPKVYPSRIQQVSELRNQKILVQVLEGWKVVVLRGKVDGLQAQLSVAGKASGVILTENSQLKARVSELEHAITVVHANELNRCSASTSTGDLGPQKKLEIATFASSQGDLAPISPDQYTTPVSRTGSPVASRSFNYMTPESVKSTPMSAVAPTPGTSRKSWEKFLRPYAMEFAASTLVEPRGLPTTELTSVDENVDPKASSEKSTKGKLRAISADLQKISDSMAALERRKQLAKERNN